MKTIEFVVKIEGQFSMTKAEMQRKLHDWIKHYGHTAPSFGFEFKGVRKLGENEE